jgi:hypothetical protein
MFVILTLPFQPKRWHLTSILISAKFTLGVVVLVVCEVYWTQYRDFAVASHPDENVQGPVTVTLSDYPNLYSGWNLIAYLLATTPTMEGTVKKGFFRAVGSAAGGFAAWIAIIVCSGTYADDDQQEVNLYGLVAWLTVTTAIASYLTIPDGPLAMMGPSPASGMYSMYFVMTQALCALEVALGYGDRNTIVANRIVANLTGVLMAIHDCGLYSSASARVGSREGQGALGTLQEHLERGHRANSGRRSKARGGRRHKAR